MIVSRLLGAVHVASAVLVATGTSGPVRLVVLAIWVLVVPGWAFVTHLRVDVATRIALAVSLSLALSLVVSTLLVMADRYQFPTAFWSLFVLVTPSLLLAQVRPLRTPGPDNDSELRPDIDADARG